MRKSLEGMSVPLISAGYKPFSKALLLGASVLGPSLFAYALLTDRREGLTPFDNILLGGLIVLWFGGFAEALLLRITVFEDRVVRRGRLGRELTVAFADVANIQLGSERTVIRSTRGLKLEIPGAIENYDEITSLVSKHRNLRLLKRSEHPKGTD